MLSSCSVWGFAKCFVFIISFSLYSDSSSSWWTSYSLKQWNNLPKSYISRWHALILNLDLLNSEIILSLFHGCLGTLRIRRLYFSIDFTFCWFLSSLSEVSSHLLWPIPPTSEIVTSFRTQFWSPSLASATLNANNPHIWVSSAFSIIVPHGGQIYAPWIVESQYSNQLIKCVSK